MNNYFKNAFFSPLFAFVHAVLIHRRNHTRRGLRRFNFSLRGNPRRLRMHSFFVYFVDPIHLNPRTRWWHDVFVPLIWTPRYPEIFEYDPWLDDIY